MFWEGRVGYDPREALRLTIAVQYCAGTSDGPYVLMKRVPKLMVGPCRHFLEAWNASPFSETLK